MGLTSVPTCSRSSTSPHSGPPPTPRLLLHPLHSFNSLCKASVLSCQSIRMFSTARSTGALALRGTCRHHLHIPLQLLTSIIAKPCTALALSMRAGPCAMISNTRPKPAAPQQTPGIVAGNPSALPPMKARREVPLPSQEGKKGVMQFALYVAKRSERR